MPYTVTQKADKPILLVEVSDPFDFCKGPRAIRAEILRIVGDVARPFFIIYDPRELSITFADIVIALADTIYAQDDAKGILQKYSRMLLVGSGPLLTLAIESINRFVVSDGDAKAFGTLEEALNYAHSQVVGSD